MTQVDLWTLENELRTPDTDPLCGVDEAGRGPLAGPVCAAAYLCRHGYRILARNYSCRFGEIDIIAADRHYVVFVEVKLRASDRFVRAGAYVTPAKQARIRTAASLWLAEHETELQPRFDVIEIYGDADTPRRQRRLNQIENAFE